MDANNPWQVESIEAFYFLKCPECMFFTKADSSFYKHAVENHSLSFVLFGKPVISKELLAQKGILNEEHIELKQTKNCDQELLFSEETKPLKEKEKETEIVSMTDLEFLNNSKENEELSNKEIEVEYNEINLEDSEIEYENNDKDELSDELSDDLSDELLNKKIRGNTRVASNGQAQIKTRIRRLACMCPNCKNGVRGQINIADGKPMYYGSCHFDRALNDEFSVEFLMFFWIILSADIKIRSERSPIHSKLSLLS